MDCARAFAPGNISGVFKIIAHQDPEKMHSLGMGLTVSEGVVVEVRRADESVVRLNGEVATFPTVRSVAAAVTDVAVSVAVETALPISSGFGLSGASALATAYALNSLLDLGRSEEELATLKEVFRRVFRTDKPRIQVCAELRDGPLIQSQHVAHLVESLENADKGHKGRNRELLRDEFARAGAELLGITSA